jgi:hypothetical protein
MILGKLTLVTLSSSAHNSTAHPAHQSHVLCLDCYSFGVYGKGIGYYSNILVKL